MLNQLKAPAARALAPCKQAIMSRQIVARKSYSTAAATGSKTPKRRRFSKFLFTSALLLATGYSGALFLAMRNRDFYNTFRHYAPFGESLINYIEETKFRKLQTKASPTQESLSIGGNNKMTAFKIPDAPKTPAAPAAPAPAAAPAAAKTVAKEVKEAAKPAPAPKVVESNTNTAVKAHKIDTDKASGSSIEFNDIDPLLRDVASSLELLDTTDGQGNLRYQPLINALNAASESIKQQRLSLEKQYKDNLAAAKDEIEKSEEKAYLDAKSNLVDAYNKKLQAALEAVTEKSVAAANNKVQTQYVELLRKFNSDLFNRVETERDGRLSKLNELSKDVEELQQTMIESGKSLESGDGIVSYFVELANLQRVLYDMKNVPLGPYLDSLTRSLPSDPLVKAVVDAIPSSVKNHGVLSHVQLAARFQLIEPEIRQASLVSPDAGVGGHIASVVASQLIVPKQGFPEGDDTESVLARANGYLQQGDITSAVSEVNSLKGWPKKLASDWLDEGRKRSELEFLVSVLADEGRLWGISRKA